MNIKKLTAAITASLALTALSALTASAASFTDTRGHWAESIINTLADAGVVHGISENEFNPDGTVTRAEFFKMALGAAGIEDVPYRNGECLDVTASDWFGNCIQSALDKGLIPEAMIGGYASRIAEDKTGSKAIYSGYFEGNAPIKREEMAYITESVYQYSLDENSAGNITELKDMYFTDIASISHWALGGVHHAYSDGFITGMDDDTFAPNDTATRAQAAVIISKLLEKQNRGV